MPNLITDEQYKETVKIINGKEKLNPVFKELKEWYMDNAGFEIYNFYIQKNKYGKKEDLDKYQLNYLSNGLLYVKDGEFCVGTIHDVSGQMDKKMIELRENSFLYFEKLRKKHNMFLDIEWLHNVVSGYDFNPIWWCEIASNFASKAIPVIRDESKNCNIYKIVNSGFGRITVFFDKDEDLAENRNNGVCSAIDNKIDEFLKKQRIHKKLKSYYEKADIVDYSTKETLDRDYRGNLFFYYK